MRNDFEVHEIGANPSALTVLTILCESIHNVMPTDSSFSIYFKGCHIMIEKAACANHHRDDLGPTDT
jgi:hypothetical protein